MDWLLNLSECMGPRFLPVAPAILDLYFNNLQTAYAEVKRIGLSEHFGPLITTLE